MKNFRIRIFQPCVPEYRVALFNGIGRRYRGCSEVWAAAQTSPYMVSRKLGTIAYDYSHNFRSILGSIKWQEGLNLDGLVSGDVVVVCGDLHQLSSIWIALVAKCRGIRVVWWGHHWTSSSKKIKVAIRLSFARLLSDVYLCYTKTGIDFLRVHGFSRERVFATCNAIDQIPIQEAIKQWNTEKINQFKISQGIQYESLLLVCGVIHKKMRILQLLEAMTDERLRQRRIRLAVVGDGPEREAAVAYANDNGIGDQIFWLGASTDQMFLAPWFLSATAFVYPGAIGLGILHAFSYGLPVITHGNVIHQMPEFEALRNGRNGLVFEENNVSDLADKIICLLNDVQMQANMKKLAHKVAYEEYSMGNMINNFCEAIEAAHSL